jgi:hypothetical protein
MKIFSDYIKEADQQTRKVEKTYIGDEDTGYGFYTNKYGTNSISNLNNNILRYITNIYQPYGFKYQSGNKDIDVNGRLINTEYIDKMVNNYTIFKSFIVENRINDEVTFYRLINSKLDDIYNYNGDFFNRETLSILVNTTRKGNIGERNSLAFFKKSLQEKKGISVNFISPTIEEDVSGIDAKFIWLGKEITIQVKPYDRVFITELTRKVKAHSQGSLSLNTDYLIVYNLQSFIIVKGKDVIIEGNFFTFQEDKIVSKKITPVYRG